MYFDSAFLVDMNSPSLAARRPQIARSELESFGPVVLERKLHAIIVSIESVVEIHPSAILELAADRHLGDRVVKQVRKSVVSLVEVRRVLGVGVLNIQH